MNYDCLYIASFIYPEKNASLELISLVEIFLGITQPLSSKNQSSISKSHYSKKQNI